MSRSVQNFIYPKHIGRVLTRQETFRHSKCMKSPDSSGISFPQNDRDEIATTMSSLPNNVLQVGRKVKIAEPILVSYSQGNFFQQQNKYQICAA